MIRLHFLAHYLWDALSKFVRITIFFRLQIVIRAESKRHNSYIDQRRGRRRLERLPLCLEAPYCNGIIENGRTFVVKINVK